MYVHTKLDAGETGHAQYINMIDGRPPAHGRDAHALGALNSPGLRAQLG